MISKFHNHESSPLGNNEKVKMGAVNSDMNLKETRLLYKRWVRLDVKAALDSKYI